MRKDKLNSKQLKILDYWLRLPCAKFDGKFTNWESICRMWLFADNPTSQFKQNAEQPDYATMENMIGK